MSTPKGMRTKAFKLDGGDQVMIYSDTKLIFLQVRREVPTEQDILAPSVKAAVALTTEEALGLVTEILEVVNSRMRKSSAVEIAQKG